jgi:uncharacterized protein YbjQ (UPF0145 family)
LDVGLLLQGGGAYMRGVGRVGTVVFVLLSSTGCSSNPGIDSLSPEQRGKIASLSVYQDAPSSPHYEVIGTVKGLSCHQNARRDQVLTQEEAFQGLKINAAKLKADAVINTFCQRNSGTDWSNNCWASFVCVGDAIRYTK